MALRHQLWLDLPLSVTDTDRFGEPVSSEMNYAVRVAHFGSVADSAAQIDVKKAIERLATAR